MPRVQGLHSDVDTEMDAIILGNTTNSSEFIHMDKNNECIICPMCEFKIYCNADLPNNARFGIFLPLLLKKNEKIAGQTVKFQNGRQQGIEMARRLRPGENLKDFPGVSYISNKNGVTLLTHFTKFIVTADGIDCRNSWLNRTIGVLFYSKMTKTDVGAYADIHVYLCGLHYKVEAYKQVTN